MSKSLTAALTLSLGVGKDKLMQAAGRLRKLGRDQKPLFVLTK